MGFGIYKIRRRAGGGDGDTQLFAGGGGCSFGVGEVELLSSSSSLDCFRTMSSSPLVLLPLFLVCCCGGRLFVMVYEYFMGMST